MIKRSWNVARGEIQTTICRKPTHTDRLLDQSSHNPTSHKATTIRTLTRRAQLVCDSPESLQDETHYLNNVFSKNNYNTDFVRRNTHSNTDSNTQTNGAAHTYMREYRPPPPRDCFYCGTRRDEAGWFILLISLRNLRGISQDWYEWTSGYIIVILLTRLGKE